MKGRGTKFGRKKEEVIAAVLFQRTIEIPSALPTKHAGGTQPRRPSMRENGKFTEGTWMEL
jgi:hypothetical protein